MNYTLSIFLRVLFFIAPAYFSFGQSATISSLKFLGAYEVPSGKLFEDTTIGGLSGIDYDPNNEIYYLISDDRSGINPVRYYTARLFLSETGIDTVEFVSVRYLLQANGNVYPNSKTDAEHAPDPESIRANLRTGPAFLSFLLHWSK